MEDGMREKPKDYDIIVKNFSWDKFHEDIKKYTDWIRGIN